MYMVNFFLRLSFVVAATFIAGVSFSQSNKLPLETTAPRVIAPRPSSATQSTISPERAANEVSTEVAILKLQIRHLSEQSKALEDRFTVYLLIITTVFAIFGVVFAIIPFVTGKALERRAQESHNLAIEIA